MPDLKLRCEDWERGRIWGHGSVGGNQVVSGAEQTVSSTSNPWWNTRMSNLMRMASKIPLCSVYFFRKVTLLGIYFEWPNAGCIFLSVLRNSMYHHVSRQATTTATFAWYWFQSWTCSNGKLVLLATYTASGTWFTAPICGESKSDPEQRLDWFHL